jgi:hypothetical protein
MAWLLGDGFDFYANASDMVAGGLSWTVSSVNPGGTSRFGVGQSIVPSNGSTAKTTSFTNSTTIYANMAAKPNAVIVPGSLSPMAGFQLLDGANNQLAIAILFNGTVVVTAGAINGAALATSPQIFLNNTVWHHLQFKIVIDNTVGSVEMRVDGNPTNNWTATGLNTRNGSTNNFVNIFNFTSLTGANGVFFDDFYLFNDQGVSPNTWQGDVRSLQLMPNSDQTITWTPKSAGTNFSQVNELIANGDTSYVFTNTPGNQDYYGCQTLTVVPFNIIAVQTKMYSRMDDTGPHSICFNIKSSSTVLSSPTTAMASNYTWIQMVNTVDPNTSIAWTIPGVNALQIGPNDVL